MPSTTLIKALEGDEYSLVFITEQMQFNTISPTDLKHILKQKSKIENSHAQYLYALCLAGGRGCDVDIKSAKTILKQLAARDNSFAANLLQSSSFYYSFQETDKERNRLKAIKANNPLAILNDILDIDLSYMKEYNEIASHIGHWDIESAAKNSEAFKKVKFEDEIEKMNKLIETIPKIFYRLSPEYQKELLMKLKTLDEFMLNKVRIEFSKADSVIVKSYQIRTTENLYQLALCFEKIGAINSMYRALHNIIKNDIQVSLKYKRKLVKILEKHISSSEISFFGSKPKLDYETIKKEIEKISKMIITLDKKLGNLSDNVLKKQFSDLEIHLQNYTYVLDVKGHELRNNQSAVLTEKLNRAQSLLQNLAGKINPDTQNKADFNP